MANANNITMLSVVPLFYGQPVVTGQGAHASKTMGVDGLSAEEFLRRVEAMKGACNNNDWDNERGISKVANFFRAEAHTWWTLTVQSLYRGAELNEIRTDWEAFVKLFRRKYFVISSLSDCDINFTQLRQQSKEEAVMFVERCATQVHYHKRMVVDSHEVAAFDPTDLDVANNHQAAFRTWLAHNDQDNHRAHILTFILKYAQSEVENAFTTYADIISTRVIAAGLSNRIIRQTVLDKLPAKLPLKDICELVRLKEAAVLAVAASPGQAPPRSLTAAIGSEGDDLVDSSAAAVKSSGGSKARSSKKPAQSKPGSKGRSPPPATATPSGSCGYCSRGGHTETVCWTKHYAMKEERAKRSTELAAPGTAYRKGPPAPAAAPPLTFGAPATATSAILSQPDGLADRIQSLRLAAGLVEQ